jgi:hypothetical protein
MYHVGIAYLLWFLSGCGVLGFHRFYLGKYRTGILWMFTGGLGTVGAIYDFFTLAAQVQVANIRLVLNDPNFRAARREGWGPRGQAAGEGENWRRADDMKSRIVREKESLERSILKLARENKGILTVSEVALAAEVDLDEAKKALDALVSRGFAELRVRKSGTIVYTLPEFMGRNEDLEDF